MEKREINNNEHNITCCRYWKTVPSSCINIETREFFHPNYTYRYFYHYILLSFGFVVDVFVIAIVNLFLLFSDKGSDHSHTLCFCTAIPEFCSRTDRVHSHPRVNCVVWLQVNNFL